MNTTKRIASILFAAAVSLTASCEKDGGVFMRENDHVACDCTEQTIEQNILCDGQWTADCSGVEWIAVTPEQGSGNGKDYGSFQLHIEYNAGAERTGTVHLVYEGVAYPVTVTQGACEFAYGTPAVNGNLFQNIAGTATVSLPYTRASGRESVEISGAVSGAAAEGISIATATYASFSKGSGELTVPIEGTPVRSGVVNFELFADGVSVGSCRTIVISDPNALPEGLPVGWNFYAAGVKTPRGSAYDYSWTTDAVAPASTPDPLHNHRVLPTAGNADAYLTASGTIAANTGYSFNPGIQIQGLKENDYWLFVIPVKNIGADHLLSVEAALGAAGSGPGYYALEYSSDGQKWMLAAGSELREVFGASAQVHYYVPTENTAGERKTYNKETDKGYRKYTFPLTGIETIYEGNLYLRLRVCMNRRANASETTNTIATAWGDLKGFEVELVDE